MAWVAVTLYGKELVLGGSEKPVRNQGTWNVREIMIYLALVNVVVILFTNII